MYMRADIFAVNIYFTIRFMQLMYIVKYLIKFIFHESRDNNLFRKNNNLQYI